MTDFGPIIANPKTLLLGAAAQVGIFLAFWGALATDLFSLPEAAAIAIIGGADGPTTIFLSAQLAPELLGITRCYRLLVHGLHRLYSASGYAAADDEEGARD